MMTIKGIRQLVGIFALIGFGVTVCDLVGNLLVPSAGLIGADVSFAGLTWFLYQVRRWLQPHEEAERINWKERARD
jgi:hypothetical protein